MLLKKAFVFIIMAMGGCTQHQFQQQDARITNNNLPEPGSGKVFVRASPHYQRNKLHKIIWGNHYRQVWQAPVAVPVLDITSLPNPLKPKRMGGGLQTTSLNLTDAQGRSFTLRTLDKDPTKSLSPRLQKSFISRIMRDQTSAINPYASLTIPLLAGAVGVFHTNPVFYYVPANAPGLGEYSSQFAGQLAMLEEKYENKIDLLPTFSAVTEVINTEELFKRQQKFSYHRVEQIEMARARLLDVIIGDWDRHEGQWTWAQYKPEPELQLYKPIPKDRDYAFYRYQDGVLTWLLSRRLLFGKVNSFIHNIPDVKGLIYKGRALDNQMLNQLTANEWAEIATSMQQALPDEKLQEAMRRFPEAVYLLEGEKTFKHLQKQVKRLPKTAREYYKILAREVTILGSDEKEKFVVTRMPDNTTVIEVFNLPGEANEEPRRLYHRVFKPQETKIITLNGLGSADEYIIKSLGGNGPKILLSVQPKKDTITGMEDARKIKIKEKEKKNKKKKKT